MEYFIIMLVILVPSIFLTFFTVNHQTVAVIERFGKYIRTATSGLNLKIPFIEKVSGVVDLRIQQLDVEVETKTKDNVFVQMMVSVQYKVIDNKIYEAFYKLGHPSKQIQAYVFDVIRAKVPQIDLDDVFSKKDEIAIDVNSQLQDIMHSFGFEIIKTLVSDIQPNENVKNAMNEINTSLRLRIATQERSEAEKIMRVKQAEAEAEANILHGKGIAGQRKAIIEGLKESMNELRQSAPNQPIEEITHTILMIQYFDMLREIGSSSKSNTVFVNHGPGALSDIVNQFRETLLSTKFIDDEEK
ncbi:SPFH domain-containing protein [Rickettsiales endosymbiont of Stachyamoeba lipophora]|uniref:SPFH domain-containing protein n=1 Tax=Rickettsiales endosymbiont of Stachyamoeba lipophora TaxID=2486578 RepID=UPI000F6488CE|nr:SPFH domain-containing protein [Rickettsiales endosymbiont of Stachyamoeba lipophora]AZL15183.1 SPFH domain-containing protein [Rickettsiales endosymbiont of Stachyamoeba lipophora]